MSDTKITGLPDLTRLMAKSDRWQPPTRLNEFLQAVGKVVSASRYKDMYRELKPELIQSVIEVKAHRCVRDGETDIEELVDIAAYAALLMLRVTDHLPSILPNKETNANA